MDVGEIGDAIGPVATAVSLAIAFWVLSREQRDRRTAQARRISAWSVEVAEPREDVEHGAVNTMGGKSVRVKAKNASEEPVYEFTVWVHFDLSPKSGRIGSLDRVLPPGEHDVWVDGVQIPEGGLAAFPTLDVTFVDTRGRRWQRLHNGRLGRDRISHVGRMHMWSDRLRWKWRLIRKGSGGVPPP